MALDERVNTAAKNDYAFRKAICENNFLCNINNAAKYLALANLLFSDTRVSKSLNSSQAIFLALKKNVDLIQLLLYKDKTPALLDTM